MIGSLNIKKDELINFCNQFSYILQYPQIGTALKKGQSEYIITGIEPINTASSSDITFCRFEDEFAELWIKTTKAGCVIVPKSFENASFLKPKTTYIFADYPRLALLNLINLFWHDNDMDHDVGTGIHPDAEIGENVKIGKFCVIGPDVKIGDDTVIGNNTTIMHAQIGQRCHVGSSVTIGGEGFGFEDEGDDVLNFPHLGGVIIGDDVRIGSSTCIDRASLGNTIIEDLVKIDNLVHVAHNVIIGRATKVIAMTIIGGSTKIGQKSWIAPGVSLRDWISIGDNALVGLGAVVTKNVEDDQAVIGNPAKPIEKTKKRYR